MEEERRQLHEQERREEMEREKLRQEKRAAKEKRREENRLKEEERKREMEVKIRHEMQLNGSNGTAKNGTPRDNGSRSGAGASSGTPEGDSRTGVSGFFGSLLMFLLGLGVIGAGVAVSLVWIYTEGKLDSKSVSTALPVIQADVEDYLLGVGHKTVRMYEQAEKLARPYIDSSISGTKAAWKEGGIYMRKGARYVEENHGETLSGIWQSVKFGCNAIWRKLLELWQVILPYLLQAWEASKPFFHQLGKFIIEKSVEVWEFLHSSFPAYMDYLSEVGLNAFQFVTKTFQKISEAF